jgi:hypothetical protein
MMPVLEVNACVDGAADRKQGRGVATSAAGLAGDLAWPLRWGWPR